MLELTRTTLIRTIVVSKRVQVKVSVFIRNTCSSFAARLKAIHDVGCCTHLSWVPYGPSVRSLPLLAVAFENGFAVFHVVLPVVIDTSVKLGYQVIPEPTQSTVVSATPILSPVVAKRWIGKHSYSSVSWLQYGPHTDPLVAVVLQDAEAPVAKVLLCAFHFPMHSPRHLSKSESPLLSCCVVASTTVAKDSTMYPSGLLQNHRFLVLFSKERISSMSLSSDSTEPSALGNLGQTVTSALPGLSSSGDPYLTDSETDKDGILYIFSRISCERTSHVGETSMQGWSPPARRMFLCRVLTGDTKETCIEERKEQEGFGDRDDVSGGAVSDVICELHMETLAHLSPVRIVRCLGGNMCAVLFRTSLGSKANVTEVMSLDINTIALVDFESNEPIIHVVQGRDIAFFTSDSAKEVKGLLLSQDGSSLTRFHWKASGVFDLTTSFRPILGVDNNKDYVHTERIKLYTEDSKLSLIVLGRRLRDSQYCFVAGDICDTEDSFSTDWSKLLPNLISGRSAWLHSGENVFDFVGLQGDGSGYRNFALSTSSRVLILSSALIVVAEANRCTATSTLAPIGSFAVCFSTDYNVRYICCMDKGLSSGTIVSLPQTRFRSECNILIAIRPDRMLFCPCQSVVSLAEFGQSHEKFCLQTAVTRPVMLLEPMVANAICTNGKQNTYNPVLRVVVEKFGRKVTSTSHGENEGIGPYGAGITSSTFELLSKYGLSSATSWLITGTPRFERASNSTILPLWLPIGPKSACTQSSDAMLHVISQGDSYFSEYVKSPNQSSISTLPRQSDPIAFLCREHAQSAIQRGKTFDALKTLDIAGNESTENLALQLSLLLEKSKRPQASGIFKSLSGLSASDKSLPSASMKSSSSLAALALAIEKNSREPSKKIEIDENLINGWMRNLAPSLQRSKTFSRTRQRIFSDSDVKDSMEAKVAEDKLWTTPCNESKHVW